MDRIGAQAEKLNCAYPVGLTVAEMKRRGFVVDEFIPDEAVYELKRPDHVMGPRRSLVADPDYVFAWMVPGGPWAEMSLAIDREILGELWRSIRVDPRIGWWKCPTCGIELTIFTTEQPAKTWTWTGTAWAHRCARANALVLATLLDKDPQ